MISYQEIIDRLVSTQGWERDFATHYALERLYHGSDHEKALQVALRGPFAPHQEAPSKDSRKALLPE